MFSSDCNVSVLVHSHYYDRTPTHLNIKKLMVTTASSEKVKKLHLNTTIFYKQGKTMLNIEYYDHNLILLPPKNVGLRVKCFNKCSTKIHPVSNISRLPANTNVDKKKTVQH